MGDTTSHPSSHPFPKSGGASGYIRQKNSNQSATEEFGLRSDIGKDRGVTTVIAHGSAPDLDLELGGDGGKGQWNNSASKLAEVSSDEEEQTWRKGIRKTTVSTQVAD